MNDKSTSLSAAEIVVEYIKNGIRSGKYQYGDKIPSEGELADKLGVGRSSLREGMNILRAVGLIETKRGCGSYIDNKTEENFIDVLGLRTSSTTTEFMILRKVIEVGTISLACQKISDKEIDRMQELTDLLVPGTPIERCVDADREFHTTIMNVLGNQFILALNNMIYLNRMDTILLILNDPSILEDTRKAHQTIIDALRTKNQQACTTAMTIHLNHTMGHMVGLNML